MIADQIAAAVDEGVRAASQVGGRGVAAVACHQHVLHLDDAVLCDDPSTGDRGVRTDRGVPQ